MLLYFHMDPLGNFGDDLNPWLWPKVFPGAFSGHVCHDPRHRQAFPRHETLFVGIGTLLNSRVPAGNPKCVFGAGVGYGDAPRLDASWEVLFVRGPLTARALDLPAHRAITDPALLAADYAPAAPDQAPGIAYMPHCASARDGGWPAVCADLGVRMIDPHWSVEQVLQALRNTSVLVTEALHGAILADAMRIPWVPVKTSPVVLDFKWVDWCRSLGIEYQPVRLPTLWQPAAGPVARLKRQVKLAMARAALKKLLANHRPLLSGDATSAELRVRLDEQVGAIRERLATQAVAG